MLLPRHRGIRHVAADAFSAAPLTLRYDIIAAIFTCRYAGRFSFIIFFAAYAMAAAPLCAAADAATPDAFDTLCQIALFALTLMPCCHTASCHTLTTRHAAELRHAAEPLITLPCHADYAP